MTGMEDITYYLGRYIAGLSEEYRSARAKIDLEKMREINDVLINASILETDYHLMQIRSDKNA